MSNVSTAHTGRQNLAHETPRDGMSGMRSANGKNPSINRRATARRGSPTYSTEERETVRRGLRILARMIAHAHLRRQESRSPTDHGDGD